MKKTILALSAAALALTGTTAIAQYRGAGHNADTDGDGTYSMEELKAAFPDMADDVFATVDANGDGAVDADELAAAQEAGTLPM